MKLQMSAETAERIHFDWRKYYAFCEAIGLSRTERDELTLVFRDEPYERCLKYSKPNEKQYGTFYSTSQTIYVWTYPYRTSQQIDTTLRHETIHFRQHVRKQYVFKDVLPSDIPYLDQPWEVEARGQAEELKEWRFTNFQLVPVTPAVSLPVVEVVQPVPIKKLIPMPIVVAAYTYAILSITTERILKCWS